MFGFKRGDEMYNGIQRIDEVIEYIEDNITSPIDCNELSAKMNLSVYEFRRIFSFVVGCPLSEYIRKRRLSLAACEIITSDKVDMLKISEKYGYSSQSAFIKAFGEQHGVSPTVYLKEKCEIQLFTRPKFELNVSGRENIAFKITEDTEYLIYGFKGFSDFTDTCCCEDVWNEFYESGTDIALAAKGKDKNIYVSYQNSGENVECTIGARGEKNDGNMPFIKISPCKYACFKMNTVDDDAVNRQYGKILYEWLPSANLRKKGNVPTIEVYPFDMSEDGFEWEIRIPIE